MLMPLGFFMGMPLPAGITMAGNADRRTIAWCWALNGAASVIASSLAVVLAMYLGFTVVLLVSLMAYAGVFVLMHLLVKNTSRLA